MTYPPALPAGSSPVGNLGPTSSAPGNAPAFSNPNGATWTALGPGPLNEGGSASGRMTAVAVDPTNDSNIYIAAAGGGVWQSTDGGNTYTPLTDTQGTLSMGALAVAPSNHLKIYAGTGEANNALDSNFGLGILVSNDGGATWTLSTGPSGVFNRLAVSKISVDPTNANTAFATFGDLAENGICCSNTGIYKTTDGGVTWTNVTAAASLDSSWPWSDVVVDPNTPSIIYAAHGDPFADNTANGVYRSTDGGTSWSLLKGAPNGSGFGRVALAVAASASTAGSHVLYVAMATKLGGSSVLYEMLVSKNADAGTPTFTDLTSTPNFGGSGGQGWYDWIIAVDPANANNVYAAGALNYNSNTDNVIRTTNGGTSWTDITTVGGIEPHTDCHGMALDSSSRLLLGTDGGVWRYDPAGPSWTNLNGNINTIQFTGIGIHPTSTQTVVGGSQDNGTELTTGNLNWNSTDGGDGGYAQISQTNPLICYANHPIGSFGSSAFFRVSTDGCNTFQARTPKITNSGLFNFYAPIFVDPSNGNRVFLGGDAIYESTNAGSSWSSHTNPSTNGTGGAASAINSIAALAEGNTIYISAGGTFSNSQIWVSTNDGASWTLRNLPVSAAVQEIDIDPNDSSGNTAVAVINSYSAVAKGPVYRTTNGGAAWSNISGSGASAVPAIPTWSAKIDTNSSATIYVSNETGVYASNSPYGNWTAVGSGLPHAQGVHLELNSSLHELAVATHGRGAWSILTTSATTVTNVTSSTANGIYSAGANISLQVVFSGTVNVSGTPALALNSGGTAHYSSGSGSTTLMFLYTVGASDSSAHLDCTSASALTLNGGSISDSASNAASLTLPAPGTAGSLGANKSFVINYATGPPSVNIDTPGTGASVSGIVAFTGWAIDNTTVAGTALSSVMYAVDGVVVGPVGYGVIRTDVCAVYPGRAGCPNVGFGFALNTATLSVGSHTITVYATDSDASPDTGSASVTINVMNMTPVGFYEIVNRNSSKVLDVEGASTLDGALVQQWDYLGGDNQKWGLISLGNGYWEILNKNSGRVLDVQGVSQADGALVQQWDYLGGINQQWMLLPIDGAGHYEIVSRNSGKVLDVRGASTADGALVQQYDYLAGANQQWSLVALPDPLYFKIVSKNSGKVLDVRGVSTADGALVQQWDYLGSDNQKWQIVAIDSTYSRIVNKNSGKVLDVVGVSQANGALIQQWDYLSGANQQWQIVGIDGTYSRIVNKNSGKVLDVVGVSQADGAQVQQWDYLGGANQQWQLVGYQ